MPRVICSNHFGDHLMLSFHCPFLNWGNGLYVSTAQRATLLVGVPKLDQGWDNSYKHLVCWNVLFNITPVCQVKTFGVTRHTIIKHNTLHQQLKLKSKSDITLEAHVWTRCFLDNTIISWGSVPIQFHFQKGFWMRFNILVSGQILDQYG